MIAIQIGIIIFLLLVLIIIYQDEYRKRRLTRKTATLNRFWNKGQERRKSVRINAKINVLYEALPGNISPKRFSMSRNISLGGINLALNEKLFPGTILKLQLNMPESPRPIFTQGEIVWVKEISEKFTKNKEERFFVAGIKFIHMDPKDETVLNSFINQRIKSVPEPGGIDEKLKT